MSNDTPVDSLVRDKDTQAKKKMKERADKRSRSCQPNIQIGDTVLVRQKKKDKFTTKFDPAPYKVIEVKGSMVTATRNERDITRNVSHFKRIQPSVRTPEADYESSDDELDNGPDETQPAQQQPPVQVQRRYPTRQRRSCQRYGQNIYGT